MHETIDTPIGIVAVDYDGDSVQVSFKSTVSGEVIHETTDSDGTFASKFSIGVAPPKPHDEITQNGSTFEVISVRRSVDGYDVLNGNTGVWEKWVG